MRLGETTDKHFFASVFSEIPTPALSGSGLGQSPWVFSQPAIKQAPHFWFQR